MLARALGGFDVGAGKYRRGDRRLDAVAQRERDAGTGLARGAAADGVDHDHQRAGGAGHRRIDVFGRAQFADAEVGQLLAHGRHKELRIRHTDIVC